MFSNVIVGEQNHVLTLGPFEQLNPSPPLCERVDF